MWVLNHVIFVFSKERLEAVGYSLESQYHTIIIRQLIFVFLIDRFPTVGLTEGRLNEDKIFAWFHLICSGLGMNYEAMKVMSANKIRFAG